MFVLTYFVFCRIPNFFHVVPHTLKWLVPLLDAFLEFFSLAKYTQWTVCKWHNIFCRELHSASQLTCLTCFRLAASYLLPFFLLFFTVRYFLLGSFGDNLSIASFLSAKNTTQIKERETDRKRTKRMEWSKNECFWLSSGLWVFYLFLS